MGLGKKEKSLWVCKKKKCGSRRKPSHKAILKLLRPSEGPTIEMRRNASSGSTRKGLGFRV